MDVAYDHITEETLSPQDEAAKKDQQSAQASSLNTEFQEAFKAVSASPWGAKLGGWFSSARKQGETFYQDLQKEATEASEQATKGFTSLREQVANRTRGMSLDAEPGPLNQIPGEEAIPSINVTKSEKEKDSGEKQAAEGAEKDTTGDGDKPESLPADIVKEAGSLVASLRSLGAAKLKDLQKAEDAADEALLKFGTNVRNFLRDAVTITAPDDEDGKSSEVIFETQEPGTGKKVFHTTRLDAQLHAIHTSPGSFTEDPQGEEWEAWKSGGFDVEKQTDAIAKDLEKYEELRRAMEKLVPEKVDYKMFWTRYYYLRKAIEEDEKKRKEVLKGAATDTAEEVAWDDDDEEDQSHTPHAGTNKKAAESTTTLNANTSGDHLKPKEPRNSSDENKSVADSDASYDLVSGATSRATGSPKEAKKDDESDDDWE